MIQQPTIQELLKGELVLPEEVSIVDSDALPQEMKEQLEVEDGDKLLSKSFARETSKVINSEFAEIISQFKTPKSLVAVVFEYAKQHQENPEELLNSLFDPMIDIIQKGFLVSKESAEEEKTPLISNNSFQDYKILYNVHHTEDTELYMAQQKNGKFVALKIGAIEKSQVIKPMLEYETTILKKLSGKVTPKYIESKLENNPPYIVTEWIHGVSAIQYATKLRSENNYIALIALLCNISKAYAQFHEEGWLHQDIHPGNIMCDKDGNVKLIDFGLAKKIDYPYQIRAGINFYLAPESIEITGMKNSNPNILSEQYSIAAVLYEIFTGHQYCNFSLRTETMLKQLRTEAPRKFEELDIQPFPALEKVFAKALAKNPKDRFTDLNQMYSALKNVESNNIQYALNVKNSLQEREKFVTYLFKQFDATEVLYTEGLPHGPLSSIYYGAAGIAYALYRFSILHDSAYYLSLAEKWLQKAFVYLEDDQAFSNPAFEIENDPVTQSSTFNQLPGIYGVQAFISYAKGDFLKLNESILAIIKLSDTSEENDDLTLNGLGIALLLINLLDLDNNHVEKDLQIEMEKRVERILTPIIQGKGIFKKFSLEPTVINLGIAHGLGGNLYTLLRWYGYKKITPDKQFLDQLNLVIQKEIPQGCGVCIPWQSEGINKEFHTMSGWCNGSAGILMLLSEVVKISNQQKYLKDAERFAWHCWEDPANVPNLCCGLAGRAYALAYYSQVTNSKIWHQRALKLIDQAMKQREQIDTEEMPMHSLYKGQLGVALAAIEIETGKKYSMPFFGIEN